MTILSEMIQEPDILPPKPVFSLDYLRAKIAVAARK
jgi:hypothetical protein